MDVSLEDVAPTSLTLMGLRPPDAMDGHAIVEIMREPHPPQSLRPADVTNDDRTYAFSEKEEKQVMENLRRLGYT